MTGENYVRNAYKYMRMQLEVNGKIFWIVGGFGGYRDEFADNVRDADKRNILRFSGIVSVLNTR